MMSGHFEGPNQNDHITAAKPDYSGQIHDQAGLPVPNTIHFSPILDVNMFVRMYVWQIF